MAPEVILRSDLMLTIGMILIIFSVLSFLSAWVTSRLSLLGLIMLVSGLGLIGGAYYLHPQGYSFADAPYALLHVLSHYVF